MTERDDAPEGFLERWSRRKIEAEREVPAAPAEADSPAPDREAPPQTAIAGKPQSTAEPAFDLTKLPSLDSITAATDIRAFLVPGVPAELARAALRRAWAADPAIRDFVGLAENAWDFTTPDAVAGFGPLAPDFDIKKVVAQVFGEREKSAPAEAAPTGPQPASGAEEVAGIEQTATPGSAAELDRQAAGSHASGEQIAAQQSPDELVQRDNITAVHKSISAEEPEERKKSRPHGGALPQ